MIAKLKALEKQVLLSASHGVLPAGIGYYTPWLPVTFFMYLQTNSPVQFVFSSLIFRSTQEDTLSIRPVGQKAGSVTRQYRQGVRLGGVAFCDVGCAASIS